MMFDWSPMTTQVVALCLTLAVAVWLHITDGRL